MKQHIVEVSAFYNLFFLSKKSSVLWLFVRLYVGYEWLIAGWEKIQNPAWVGSDAGKAIVGFINGALTKTAGAHPDVQGWYAGFLSNAVLPQAVSWSALIAYGELLVGLGLITGTIVGITAFFGAFMNLNFLLAGTVSINPILLMLSIGLILAWRVAGYIGLDHFVLPRLFKSTRPKTRLELDVI